MMQTLKILGVDVAGEEMPRRSSDNFKNEDGSWKSDITEEQIKEIEKSEANAKMMNPLGFYEVPGVVMRGIRGRDATEYYGKALKIITSAMVDRQAPNGGFIGTDKNAIGKVILCLRDPKHIAISQKSLSDKMLQVAGDDEDWVYHNSVEAPSPLRYMAGIGPFISWLDKNREVKDRILVVDYEDMHADCAYQIDRICSHLNINPTAEQIEEAVSNIKPSLRRSSQFIEWAGLYADDGIIAEEMYTSLKDLETSAMSAIIEERVQRGMLELVRWLDDTEFKTHIEINSDLYRHLCQNLNNIRTVLTEKSERMRKLGWIPSEKCKNYSISEKNYTIKRPVDVGDLTRPMVSCGRDDDFRTAEECNHCWNNGWNRYGINHNPQRLAK